MKDRDEKYIFFTPNENLTLENQKIISNFLLSDPYEFDWKHGIYHHEYNGLLYKIYLSHDIKKRYRKHSKNQNEFRYSFYYYENGPELEQQYEMLYETQGTTGNEQLDFAIYNNNWKKERNIIKDMHSMIGYGGFGSVLRVDATIIINSDNTLTMKPYGMERIGKKPKKRVIKVQTKDLGFVMDNYEKFKLFTHVKVKPPMITYARNKVTDKESSHMVMNELEGEDFVDILQEESDGVLRLTLEKRILITYYLILALITQIDAYDIVHRDIKPENIRVNLDDEKFPIIIFDFDSIIKQGIYAEDLMGTLGYIPPESFLNISIPASIKVDIFAMGRVLSKLWGMTDDDFNLYSDPTQGENKISINLFNSKIFDSMGIGEKKSIKELVMHMVDGDHENRYDLRKLLIMAKKLLIKKRDIIEKPKSDISYSRSNLRLWKHHEINSIKNLVKSYKLIQMNKNDQFKK